MKKVLFLAAAGLFIAANSHPAFAEDVAECRANCTNVYSACQTKAEEKVNELDIQDAKAVCYDALLACNNSCGEDPNKPE